MIEVSQVTVGMFIHLDLGWMAHPFPLSSFKLCTQEQLQILRRLGLAKVRWSPGRSDLQANATPLPLTPVELSLPEPVVAISAEEQVRAAHRTALDAQRASLQLCERQYDEAASALREVTALVSQKPQDAGEQSLALTSALLDKMLVAGDLNIRLVNEAAGERSTAHALNVSIISLLLGRTFGLNRSEMMDLGVGALLHDIGKIELQLRFRNRDSGFSVAETQAYQQHVAKGVALGQAMGLTSGPLLIIAQHHENADGSGFPQRINVDRMSTGARIVALVNRFDGLCNPLLASKALTPHEALSLIFAQGRNRFDATMLNAFIRMMGVYPPGSAVQLTDDRYALVVAVNTSRPLKPQVMVYDPKIPREEALVLNLEQQADLGIRRSLKAELLPRAALDYLSPRPRTAYFFEPIGGECAAALAA